jgi:putative ABC transport system permease protein
VLRVTTVSPSFFATYGMTVLAGEPQVGIGEAHLVIDAKGARLLGFSSPQAAIGELVQGPEPRRIVAVVKEVKLESAREAAMPQGFVLSDKPQGLLTVHGADLAVLRQTVEELWKAYGPPLVYEIRSADEQRADAYRQEQQLTTLLAVVALLAVGVAMLGAYALVVDTLRRRRTEFVLHRLHGAGDIGIVRQATAEFVLPLCVSAVASMPLAVWLGQRYLAQFVDRVGSGTGIVLPILAASAAMLAINAVAVLRHLRQALALQPVEALR